MEKEQKQEYERLEIEVIYYEYEDVITTSDPSRTPWQQSQLSISKTQGEGKIFALHSSAKQSMNNKPNSGKEGLNSNRQVDFVVRQTKPTCEEVIELLKADKADAEIVKAINVISANFLVMPEDYVSLANNCCVRSTESMITI